MPGIYGIVSELPKIADDMALPLARMAEVLRQGESERSPYIFEQAAFSLATLRSRPESSSHLDNERDLFILLDGDIFELDGRKCESRMVDFRTVASLFEEHDVELAHRLVGNFNLLIWDKRRRRLVIINDWLGLGSLFYSFSGGTLRFAPEIKAILSTLSQTPGLDYQGLAEYIHFWNLVDDRTFFEDIKLFPPASILEYEAGRLNIRAYRQNTFSESNAEERSLDDLADEGLDLLRQSVARATAGRERIGITLTGGMDSRTLLALACEQGKDVLAITYGHSPRCGDNQIAKRVVEIVKPREHVFEVLSPTILADDSSEYVWLTDGLTRANCSHIIPLAKTFKDRMDVLLNGIFGGHTSIGAAAYYTEEQIRRPRSRQELHNRIYNWSAMPDWWKDLLFLPEFAEKIKQLVRQSVDEQVELRSAQASLLCDQIDLFAINNHIRRNMNQVDAWKYFVDDQRPFADPDLLKFCFSLPPKLRTGMRMYSAIYLRHFPKLAHIPWHHSGLPVYKQSNKFHDFKQNFGWLWRYYLARISAGKINLPDHHTYVQWDMWIRTEKSVREFVQSVLLDRRAMQRGWYSRAGIEELFKMEWRGGAYYNTIIELLSLELWARAFLDGKPVTAEKISGAFALGSNPIYSDGYERSGDLAAK
jgi:asparagine synthase (glutamine-hydrolysing)